MIPFEAYDVTRSGKHVGSIVLVREDDAIVAGGRWWIRPPVSTWDDLDVVALKAIADAWRTAVPGIQVIRARVPRASDTWASTRCVVDPQVPVADVWDLVEGVRTFWGWGEG